MRACVRALTLIVMDEDNAGTNASYSYNGDCIRIEEKKHDAIDYCGVFQWSPINTDTHKAILRFFLHASSRFYSPVLLFVIVALFHSVLPVT